MKPVYGNARFWRMVSLALVLALFLQYVYYSFQEMLYQESVANLHKKTTDLDAIKADIVLLTERADVLEKNDQKLLGLIETNRKSIEREVDMLDQRIPPVKPIKKVK